MRSSTKTIRQAFDVYIFLFSVYRYLVRRCAVPVGRGRGRGRTDGRSQIVIRRSRKTSALLLIRSVGRRLSGGLESRTQPAAGPGGQLLLLLDLVSWPDVWCLRVIDAASYLPAGSWKGRDLGTQSQPTWRGPARRWAAGDQSDPGGSDLEDRAG